MAGEFETAFTLLKPAIKYLGLRMAKCEIQSYIIMYRINISKGYLSSLRKEGFAIFSVNHRSSIAGNTYFSCHLEFIRQASV